VIVLRLIKAPAKTNKLRHYINVPINTVAIITMIYFDFPKGYEP